MAKNTHSKRYRDYTNIPKTVTLMFQKIINIITSLTLETVIKSDVGRLLYVRLKFWGCKCNFRKYKIWTERPVWTANNSKLRNTITLSFLTLFRWNQCLSWVKFREESKSEVGFTKFESKEYEITNLPFLTNANKTQTVLPNPKLF